MGEGRLVRREAGGGAGGRRGSDPRDRTMSGSISPPSDSHSFPSTDPVAPPL